MASIEKRKRTRPDGSTYTRHRVRWRDADGHERSETFKTRPAAVAFHARLELADATGQPLEDRDADEPAVALTLEAWTERWLDLIAGRCAAGEISPKTAEGYEQRVRVHIVPRLGPLVLRDVTVGDVQEMLTALQVAGASPSTAAGIRRTLSKIFADAQAHELVDRNVAALAKAPRVTPKKVSVFTPDEMAKILTALVDVRLGRLFVFAALTGLRASELRGLRWGDVDLDAGTYTIVKGVHRVGPAGARVAPVGIVESNPKTEGSGTTTPMSPEAAEVLRQHRVAQTRERLAAPAWHDLGYVFTNVIGGPLEGRNVLRIWQKVLTDAGVAYRPDPKRPGRGLHELRRTFATRARESGAPVEYVQGLGRWSSPQVLLASYSATTDDGLRAAASAAAASILGASARG